jgi:hypothetical protein
MIVVVLLATLHPLPAADLWWYLAMGRHIVSTASFPHINSFSYTAPTYPMIDHEWIAELLFYFLYCSGGFLFLYTFKSAMIAAAVLMFFLLSRRKGASVSTASLAVIIAIGFSKGDLFFDIRAYLFTYLFLALFLFLLTAWQDTQKARYLWPLPLFVWAWANSHGAFILSFLLLGCTVISEVMHNAPALIRKEKRAWKSLMQLAAVTAASLGLALVNPYGLKLILYPFSFMGPSIWRAGLIEWVPPDLLHGDLTFLLFFLVLTGLVIYCRKKFNTFELLSYMVFSYLALTTVRHIALFALFSIPFVAVILHTLSRRIDAFFNTLERKVPTLEVLFFFPCLIPLAWYGWSGFWAVDYQNLSMEKALFPRFAMEFIKENRLPGPIYNPYEWGGYMLWKLYPDYRVFIDGRANTSYPPEVYRESLFTMFGRKGWQETLDKYDIKAVLCNKFMMERNPECRLAEQLRADGQWQVVFEDRVELLFLKIIPENSTILQKAKRGELIVPSSPCRKREQAWEKMSHDDYQGAALLLDEAIKDDSSYNQLFIDRAYAAFRLGDLKRARSLLLKVLSRERDLFLAHYLMGRIWEQEGRIDMAIREYRASLAINPEFPDCRKALDNLLRQGGK